MAAPFDQSAVLLVRRSPPAVHERLAAPIKQLIQEHPHSAIAQWFICGSSTRTSSNVFSSSCIDRRQATRRLLLAIEP
jgi:hypothetical protein